MTQKCYMEKIFVALPVLNELDFLPKTIESIYGQSYTNFELFICVNQPEEWWNSDEKVFKCENNAKTIDFIQSLPYSNIQLIDKTSKGNGWGSKDHGVGWARKLLMDTINESADISDIIISLDADTTINQHYFKSVVDLFREQPEALALSNPYYHQLTDDDNVNSAILRYEIYMRNYAINMLDIDSPYSFTALGSAIAFPIKSYRMINGMAPKKSGEDFYFLQRIRKSGKLAVWNNETVYPASRFSDRVFFGTGPAMIKGSSGNWESYPIYHYELFEKIKATYNCFSSLFTQDIYTPLDDFFFETFRDAQFWKPFRKNYKTEFNFIQACHNKFDGLRVLQFLKSRQTIEDNQSLLSNLHKWKLQDSIPINFNLHSSNTIDLNKIRNLLHEKEQMLQKSKILI